MCGWDYLPNFSDSLQQAAAALDEQSMAWTKLQKMLLKQKADEHFKSAASFNSPANITTKRKLSMEGRFLGIYLKVQTFPKYLIRPPL